ncbi:MAG: nucleotide pyrophosphohydrolase [Pirellulaceae bacterium]|nr:nucleotide pyrophosphohydrolase [Pirellulaceae bacterium]
MNSQPPSANQGPLDQVPPDPGPPEQFPPNDSRPEAVEQWTLRQAQQQVDTWIATLGVRYFSELTNLAQLMEEVGEVARILSRTHGEQSFKDSDKQARLSDELADVLFVVICLANQSGIDLQTALAENLNKKSHRDATRHQKNEKLRG